MADMPMVDEKTTTDSSSENQIEESTSDESKAVEGSQPQLNSEESPAESGFDKRLKRQSEKIRRLAEESEYWKGVAQRYAQADLQTVSRPVAPTQPQYPASEVEQAISTLKSAGMVTKDELEEVLTRVKWDQKHTKNEAEINSNPNLPQYNREEVEEYAREKGIADPMLAYRDLYFDEIMDAYKRTGTSPKSKSTITTEKPSKPSNTAREPMTIEAFKAKLAGPNGAEFYEELAKNPQKFDSLLKQLAE